MLSSRLHSTAFSHSKVGQMLPNFMLQFWTSAAWITTWHSLIHWSRSRCYLPCVQDCQSIKAIISYWKEQLLCPSSRIKAALKIAKNNVNYIYHINSAIDGNKQGHIHISTLLWDWDLVEVVIALDILVLSLFNIWDKRSAQSLWYLLDYALHHICWHSVPICHLMATFLETISSTESP